MSDWVGVGWFRHLLTSLTRWASIMMAYHLLVKNRAMHKGTDLSPFKFPKTRGYPFNSMKTTSINFHRYFTFRCWTLSVMAYPSEILGNFRNHYRLCARGLCGTAIRWIERLSAERRSCGSAWLAPGHQCTIRARSSVYGRSRSADGRSGILP